MPLGNVAGAVSPEDSVVDSNLFRIRKIRGGFGPNPVPKFTDVPEGVFIELLSQEVSEMRFTQLMR